MHRIYMLTICLQHQVHYCCYQHCCQSHVQGDWLWHSLSAVPKTNNWLCIRYWTNLCEILFSRVKLRLISSRKWVQWQKTTEVKLWMKHAIYGFRHFGVGISISRDTSEYHHSDSIEFPVVPRKRCTRSKKIPFSIEPFFSWQIDIGSHK